MRFALKKVCREKECKARHPKYCKNGDACKFFKKKVCAYRHGDLKSEESVKTQNLLKEFEALEKEVKELKIEILDLKDNLKKKERNLRKHLLRTLCQ